MNFLNPKPVAKSGAHLDDMGDIYDHTGIFKETDDVMQIEQGERRIKGSIADLEMDQKYYGAKKVTRK